MGNSCDHMRYIYDNWKHSPLVMPFLYLLYRPNMSGKEMVGYFRRELVSFKEALERHFGVQIDEPDLWQAIKLCNETRRLQREIYELRKKKNPPITGAEMVPIMVASMAMPKEKYNRYLKELLDELKVSTDQENGKTRLMIIGSNLDDPFLYDLIEQQKAIVVTEQTCFGSRIAWEQIDEAKEDPLTAIADFYVTVRQPCPRSYGEYQRRVRFVTDMCRDFSVDGIIGERLASCDVHAGEHYMIKSDLKEAGIPFMSFEREYVPTFKGQLRTRIQAFLESMSS